MAKSIRVSDDLYHLASAEARLMHRSLAQQVEHWASLGQAVEHSNHVTIQQTALANLHAIDREDVRRGRRTSRSLHMIPKHIVRNAVLTFPDASAFNELGETDQAAKRRAKKRRE